MSHRDVILEFIENEITKGRAKNLSTEEDLLSSGILDSLGILQLVAFIDDKLGVQIPDEDVVFEHFQNINAIVDYIKSRENERNE